MKDGSLDADRLRRGHVGYALLALVEKINELESAAGCFGTDVQIHHSEIHMIMAIHNNEGIHVGGLADHLKITKGSVSEILRKIERKGLINKRIDPEKRSRLNIFLTEKGKIAHEHHIFFHEQLNEIVDVALHDHTPEQFEFLVHFLKRLLFGLDSFERE